MLPPVLVIGELNVDIVLSGLASPPVLGNEVLAQEMRMVLGSASAIFASGAARLGHPVGFVGKTGDDDFGRFCRNALLKAGISTDRLRQHKPPPCRFDLSFSPLSIRKAPDSSRLAISANNNRSRHRLFLLLLQLTG